MFRVARHRLSPAYTIIGACVALALAALAGCLPNTPPPDHSGNNGALTRADSLAQFADRHADTLCAYWVLQLDLQVDPTGNQNADSIHSYWRKARNEYEQARWAVEGVSDSLNQFIAAWFSSNPTHGFHYIEQKIFATPPVLTGVEASAEYLRGIYLGVSVPQAVTGGSLTNSVVFHGVEKMLADIDTIKFSGLDAAYSNNSFNDIFSNYNGLDSVYALYRDSVRNYSVSTDSMFTNRLQSARLALQNAGNLANLDKAAYRANELRPLEDAVKQVGGVFGVTFP